MTLTFEDLVIQQKPTPSKKVKFVARAYVDGQAAFYIRDHGNRYFFPCNGEHGVKLLDAAIKELNINKIIDQAVADKLKEKKIKKIK